MSNVIKFESKKPANPPRHAPNAMWVSVTKALLTVQHCSLVTGDLKTARELLLFLADCDLSKHYVTMPGRFYEAIENTDTEATYRAIMGVPPEDK